VIIILLVVNSILPCWAQRNGKGAHLKGQVFMSDCTDGSSIFRPIKRFASNTVFLGLMATCADGATFYSAPCDAFQAADVWRLAPVVA